MSSLLPELDQPLYASALQILGRLAMQPPPVLLLEGATADVRMAAGKYWAMLHNCRQAHEKLLAGEAVEPCMICPSCRQIVAEDFTDLHIFDGRISNRMDEEKPGPIRAMRMENMRELKGQLASKPRGSGKRVILMQGIGVTREEAQNCLLKTLEEPSPYNLFVLLTTQRQQLLPTLVSRSFCLTLPWTGSADGAPEGEIAEWLTQLENFLATGRGFLDKAAQKGQMDSALAANLVLETQKSLARAMANVNMEAQRPMDALFGKLPPAALVSASRWLAESLDMLEPGVSSARVMEALATRLFLLCRKAASY